MENQFIEINDNKIRYRGIKVKDRPFLIFLHGMAFNADTWNRLGTLVVLGKQGYSAYALDLPGFGKSSGKRLSRDKAAELLDAFVKELGIEKFILVGPSMGGGVALHYAINHQEKLDGLILIAPSGLNDPYILENLGNIKVPTLVFWGEKDNIFPVELSEKLTDSIKNVRFILCKNAGHPCYLYTPQLFHKEIIKFVQELTNL